MIETRRGLSRFAQGDRGMSEDTSLWIVRAGESVWDAERRLQGSADIPLSPAGAREAERAVDLLRNAKSQWRGTLLLTAPDEASLQTAQAIANALDLRVRSTNELKDPSLGLWEGELKAELEDRCRTAFRRWCEDPFSVEPPHGESCPDVQARVTQAVRKAVAKANGDVIVVLRPMAAAMLASALTPTAGTPTRPATPPPATTPSQPVCTAAGEREVDAELVTRISMVTPISGITRGSPRVMASSVWGR
ncbi:MAG: histidine phosphatase family protein [Planctomycetota bacterium]|nr:histidine phosphatase family protein [Planctomycetota bacterium]